MSKTQTVLGLVDTGKMGKALVHEHLALSVSEDYGFDDKVRQIVSLLEDALKNGCSTIVDASTIEMRPLMWRDGQKVALSEFLKEISKQTGIHIIASTGFYKEPFFPYSVYRMKVNEIAEVFIREITEGIEGTDIRAGLIKIGSSLRTITPTEAKVFRAAAIAHLETGVSITTHATHGTMGVQQLDILEEESVDLQHVIIGHCSLNADLSYHLSIAERGAFLGYDTIGKMRWISAEPSEVFAYQSDKIIVHLIQKMIQLGFKNQLLLSSDISPNEIDLNPDTFGRYGYTYVFQGFLPMLREAGVNQEDIDRIVIDNPRHALAIESTISEGGHGRN